MTTVTKAGGAVLPVVAWQHSEHGGSFVSDYAKTMNSAQEWPVYYSIALTPCAPAQATIDELRAEVERLTRERDELNHARNAAIELANARFDALKAKQIDVDAVMRLAEAFAGAVCDFCIKGFEFEASAIAAREALRAEIIAHSIAPTEQSGQ